MWNKNSELVSAEWLSTFKTTCSTYNTSFFPGSHPAWYYLICPEICICPVFGRGPGFSRSDGRKWELFEARNLYKYNQSTGRPRNLKFLSPVSCARCVGYFFVCLWASKKKHLATLNSRCSNLSPCIYPEHTKRLQSNPTTIEWIIHGE